MAIVWSDKYPGQISVDPGWPHGKPRNVAVPGDGSGTPLEAAWVSDLAGWQAALLEEAGIAPSGNPDNVNASDYTNAIKALANREFDSFTSDPHTWTARQVYETGYFLNDWGMHGELLYVDKTSGGPLRKLRTIRLPLSAFVTEIDGTNPTHPSWNIQVKASGYYQPGWVHGGSASSTSGLYCEVPLPTNATLESVTARVQGIPSVGTPNITLSTGLTQIENDFLLHRTVEKSSGPLDGTTLLTVNRAVDLPWLAPFDGSHQTLLVRFLGAASVVMNWCQVSFWDPGPRNY